MKLLSINLSKPKEIIHRGRRVRTGIFKEPVSAPVMLRRLNLEGDGQADRTVHGGIHKAVYLYPFENYQYWKNELNRNDLAYGQFGENFTTQGMTEDQVFIGDQFQIGGAIVEVTQPRVPCYKLAIKMDRPDFVKLFLKSGRCGFYLRVLREGKVKTGERFNRVLTGPQKMSVRQINHLLFFDKKNIEMARRALKIPALEPGWKTLFQRMVDNPG